LKIFIEFWKAKDAWHQLSKNEKVDYAVKMGPVMQDLVSKGVSFDV
jgi:hypothetical protein